MGGQTKYTKELAERVLDELRTHGSTLKAAKACGILRSTVVNWTRMFPEFNDLYARAKAEGIDALVEDTIEISDEPISPMENGAVDNALIQKARMRIDTRRWYAERLEARKYGVLQKLEHSGPAGGAVAVTIATGVPRIDDNSDLA